MSLLCGSCGLVVLGGSIPGAAMQSEVSFAHRPKQASLGGACTAEGCIGHSGCCKKEAASHPRLNL
jgi:hypothetical protein